MVGQGLANLAGAFFSAYPASGSFNRSGLNVESGAVTPFSAICSGLLLVALLFLVAPLARYLPIPSIAAILVMVAWTLFEFDYPLKAWRSHRLDFWTWAITFVLTITVSLEWAIVAGLVVYYLGHKFMQAKR